MAAQHGKCEVVRLLLESGAVVNVKNRAGEYPVHCGAFSFDRETFTVLYLKTDAINCQVFKSKHTECVEKKTGLTCSCSHCREWTKLTWSPHFDGQVCQPAVGFHVCKMKLLFEKEAQEHAASAAEVEDLRSKCENLKLRVRGSDSEFPISGSKRVRGRSSHNNSQLEGIGSQAADFFWSSGSQAKELEPDLLPEPMAWDGGGDGLESLRFDQDESERLGIRDEEFVPGSEC